MRPDPASASSVPSELDGLVPQAGPDFPVAFSLAALRHDGRSWLGGPRLAALAASLRTTEAAALDVLDRAPRPPAVLGDPAAWVGRRVPILQAGLIAWAELLWRPDPKRWKRGLGSFALRLQLPRLGAVELRGRVEEGRLDAVMQANALPRESAFEATEAFRAVLQRLGLAGELVVRATADAGG